METMSVDIEELKRLLVEARQHMPGTFKDVRACRNLGDAMLLCADDLIAAAARAEEMQAMLGVETNRRLEVEAKLAALRNAEAKPVAEVSISPTIYAHPLAQQIPDGWQLVPKEPTVQMRDAAWHAMKSSEKPAPYNVFLDVWAAALAAAPQPEEGDGE